MGLVNTRKRSCLHYQELEREKLILDGSCPYHSFIHASLTAFKETWTASLLYVGQALCQSKRSSAGTGHGTGEGLPPGFPRKHLQEADPCLFQGRGAEVSLNSHHQPREVRKDYWNLPRCKAHITPLSDLEGSG